MARYTPKSRFSGISRHGLGCNCPAISQASSPRLLMPKLNATRGFGYSMITALPGGFLPPAGASQVTDTYPKRSEEHTSELQSLMRISYAVFCLKKKKYSRYSTLRWQ